jgi:hypothetical protein
MSWKYPVGFKFIDPSGDLECKILRRRINDDDESFYVIESVYPNGKFFESTLSEKILDNNVRRGLPHVDENEPLEADNDLDFEPLTPKKRGPKPKPVIQFAQPIYPRAEPVIPKVYQKRGRKPKVHAPQFSVPVTTTRLELTADQKRRLAEWKTNRK